MGREEDGGKDSESEARQSEVLFLLLVWGRQRDEGRPPGQAAGAPPRSPPRWGGEGSSEAPANRQGAVAARQSCFSSSGAGRRAGWEGMEEAPGPGGGKGPAIAGRAAAS